VAVLTSQVERDSEAFASRRERMEELVAELRGRTAQVAQGGGEKAVARHRSRGKMTARERIDRLVDPGSAFLELSALAAWDMYEGQAPSAGIVTGIGVIEGQECVLVSNDATVKGGTYFPITVKKHLRAQEIAEQNLLARFCRSRMRSSPTESTSAGSSSTRRACLPRASRRSLR
jgi:3-methylcrotonyl-CoA carboxylase beta subunit